MLQVNFIIIYIINKISVLLKFTRISKRFLRSIIDFYFFKKLVNFFHNMKSSRFEKDKKLEKNIIKEERNLFRLKQDIDNTAIKDGRNLFRFK